MTTGGQIGERMTEADEKMTEADIGMMIEAEVGMMTEAEIEMMTEAGTEMKIVDVRKRQDGVMTHLRQVQRVMRLPLLGSRI